MKKLTLILDNTNWLEATWVEDEIQVYCESFSGHPEHIAMLRAKALEFGTELDEVLIKECIANFKMPTAEEIDEQELKVKLQEAKAYLSSTDYKVLPDYEPKSEEVVALRATAREFIRTNDVPNI